MKPKALAISIVITLFATLAISIRSTAQEQAARPRKQKEHHRYRLVDLGTFGGPESYVNAAFATGSPNQINRRGIVVGAASTRIQTPPHKQICGGPDGLVPFVFHAFEWQDGRKRDLGALPGIECSEAVSINAKGEIVGRSGNGVIDPLVGVEEIRAVLWKDGKIEDLGTFGGAHGLAVSNNDLGQIIGFSVNTTPDPFSFLYFVGGGFTNGTQTRAFLWHNGVMRDLLTLGGPDAQAFGLNATGQVIGISYVSSTPNPFTGLPTADPFLWTEDRGMIDLGSLGGVWGSATALNNRGQVIGNSSFSADPGACFPGIGDVANCHPFFWDDGKLIDLSAQSGGVMFAANAINDDGEVVGVGDFSSTGGSPFDAALWRRGVVTDLGAVAGDCFSQAFAINSRGQVIGQSISCDGNTARSFLWEDGVVFDLNTLIPHSSDLQLDNTFAISDRGEIAGFGVPSGCTLDTQCGHAFLLIPCEVEHADDDGCNGGDTPAIQNNPAAISPASTNVSQGRLTPENLAVLRDRFARRFRGLGIWPHR